MQHRSVIAEISRLQIQVNRLGGISIDAVTTPVPRRKIGNGFRVPLGGQRPGSLEIHMIPKIVRQTGQGLGVGGNQGCQEDNRQRRSAHYGARKCKR